MKIDNEVILKLEHLAKLNLTDDERTVIKKDLESILDMINTIKNVDTKNVEPLIYLSGHEKYHLRDDVSQSVGQEERKKILDNAPKIKNEHFAVPKVISNKN